MSKSPAHQKHPEHRITEQRVTQRMSVSIKGEVIAESDDVVRVDEDRSPPRFYFPRADVRMEKLDRSGTTSVCPFKGTAHYFNITANGKQLKDAVWTYETPYDEHAGLKERLAFYDDKLPEIEVKPA